MILNKLLFEAKREAIGFFTDSKGKVHPIEPTPEAIAYARKMGFKKTIGGKAIEALKTTKEKIVGKPLTKEEKDVRSKVLKKNLIHDTITGTTTGLAAGAARLAGPKITLAGGLMGAALGAGFGLGEGLVKNKILRGKSDKEVIEKVSGVPFRTGDAARVASQAAAEAVIIHRLLKKYGKDDYELSDIKNLIKNPTRRMALYMRLRKNPRIGKLVKKLGNAAIKNRGGLALVVAGLGVFGANMFDQAITDMSNAKVYGPDQPGEVGGQELFTKKALKTGMYSGKKYKYWGLGSEEPKKK